MPVNLCLKMTSESMKCFRKLYNKVEDLELILGSHPMLELETIHLLVEERTQMTTCTIDDPSSLFQIL